MLYTKSKNNIRISPSVCSPPESFTSSMMHGAPSIACTSARFQPREPGAPPRGARDDATRWTDLSWFNVTTICTPGGQAAARLPLTQVNLNNMNQAFGCM